jgi:hypothetical protein
LGLAAPLLGTHPQHMLVGRRPPRGRLRGPPLGCAPRGPLPFLYGLSSGLSRPPQSGVAVPQRRPPRGCLRWPRYPRRGRRKSRLLVRCGCQTVAALLGSFAGPLVGLSIRCTRMFPWDIGGGGGTHAAASLCGWCASF